ncbi:Isocitrate dehydrogenase [NADP], partial [Durusdinium trenchii]
SSMNSLQGLSSWGSNLLGQASEQLGPAAAAAAASIRSGVKEVKKSVKENLGNVTATAASFSAETHQLQGVNGAPAREVTEVAFLAEGAFGAVMKVSCNRTGEKFALKKISCMEGVQVASSFEAAEREAKTWAKLCKTDQLVPF